jgi:hypothetical protein
LSSTRRYGNTTISKTDDRRIWTCIAWCVDIEKFRHAFLSKLSEDPHNKALLRLATAF